MNEKIKDIAKNNFMNTWINILELYSDTALLLNACDVAKKRYIGMDNVCLSTIANMPDMYRLPADIDRHFEKEELIMMYQKNLIKKISSDFLVSSVSIFDGCMENLYEEILILKGTEVSIAQKKVRNAWTNDNMKKYLIQEIGLKTPPGKLSTPEMIFDRYEEIRIIRNAIVHNKGILSDRHIIKLNTIAEKISEDYRKKGCCSFLELFKQAGFVEENMIIANHHFVYYLRKWFYETCGFFTHIFEISL